MKDNLKYMIKNWIEWDKKSLLYFCLRVPAMVFLPIITAFIPKAMIDCINEGVTVGKRMRNAEFSECRIAPYSADKVSFHPQRKSRRDEACVRTMKEIKLSGRF